MHFPQIPRNWRPPLLRFVARLVIWITIKLHPTEHDGSLTELYLVALRPSFLAVRLRAQRNPVIPHPLRMLLDTNAWSAVMQRRFGRILSFAAWASALAMMLGTTHESAAVPPRVVTGRLRIEMDRLVNTPASNLSFPTTTMAFAPGDTGRLFMVEKGGFSPPAAAVPGRIRIFENNTISTFLDLSSEVYSANENGLLGLAFHPDYADPVSPGYRKLYTYHSVATDANATVDFPSPFAVEHHNVITEWQVSAGNPNQVDVSSRREVFRESHPEFQHNAGTITFGADGYLYGAIGNPGGNSAQLLSAQNNSNLLGKVYRIDPLDPSATPMSADPISANGKYRIPADNPFVSDPQALDEIFAYGFRNPYRFSIDSQTGMLFVGDVGQGTTEEVSMVTAGGNYGWPYRQGNDPGVLALPSPAPTLVAPIAEYSHSDGKAIVGGYVYRGSIAALQGIYVYGDFTDNNNFFLGKGKLLFSEVFDEEGNLKSPENVRVEQILSAPGTCTNRLA